MAMQMPMGSMQHMGHGVEVTHEFLMSESCGTGLQPSAWHMPMLMDSAEE